jgi:hypothetical protein
VCVPNVRVVVASAYGKSYPSSKRYLAALVSTLHVDR